MLAPTSTGTPAIVEGRLDRLEQPLGDRLREADVGDVHEQDAELVAAEARGEVGRAEAVADPRRRPSTSSSSPAAWPRLSLTVLKSSRSRKSAATDPVRGASGQRGLGLLARTVAGWRARSAGRGRPGS